MSVEGWFPLALTEAIAPGTSAGAVLKGREIVLWRDNAGAPHAWEDRCPHRGMKLSFGFVRGDHIACLYHGWEYGTDGQCRRIPAHPALEVPTSICVPSYDVAEAGGMLWVGIGDAGAPPALPEATGVRSLYLDAPLNAVMATLPSGFGATGLTLKGPLVLLDTGWGALSVGLHEIAPDRTALHLAVSGAASTETRTAIARAATRLRTHVEARVAA